MIVLNYLLYFVSGVFLDMSLIHLTDFDETRHHPMIARSKYPKFGKHSLGAVPAILWRPRYCYYSNTNSSYS